MRTSPLLLATVGALVLLPATAPAAIRETKYDVTFEVKMDETWQAETKVDKRCNVGDADGRCTEHALGSGKGRVFLRTPTPQRVSVMTGPGMKPMITFAADSAIPLRGELKRTGTFTDTYDGLWDAANPDQAQPTKDCGSHPVKTSVALGWTGRSTLQPVLPLDDVLECPSGPYEGFDYPDGVPSLQDVVARVSESKFRGTSQFRFGGKRTWKGTVTPITRTDPDDMYSRSGESETTWSWEAIFRKAKKAKRTRGRTRV